MNPTLTFFTPTYGPDLERFCFMRETMERCEVDVPHIAVVQHEHFSMFRDIPHRHKLTILSTRDVLPRAIDRRRRLWGVRRRNPRRWFGGKPIHGWVSQQLLKLSSPSVTDSLAISCIDSDLFFVRKVIPEDFYAPDGKVQLFETNDPDAEMAEWLGRNMRFVGVSPTGKPLSRFTHWATPLQREVVLDLQRLIENKYEKDWYNAILDFDMLAEYTMYGSYAKYVDGLRRVTPHKPTLVAEFWWAEQVAAIEQTFHQRVVANPAIKMVGVQGNTGKKPEDYRRLAEPIWNASLKAMAS